MESRWPILGSPRGSRAAGEMFRWEAICSSEEARNWDERWLAWESFFGSAQPSARAVEMAETTLGERGCSEVKFLVRIAT